MEFSEKGPMDQMNGHFSPVNGLESVNGIQFSLCGTPTNLICAHRVLTCSRNKGTSGIGGGGGARLSLHAWLARKDR